MSGCRGFANRQLNCSHLDRPNANYSILTASSPLTTHTIPMQQLHLTSTFSFCLTRLFFCRLLQLRLVPNRFSKKNLQGLLVREFLQAGCLSCHPTNRVKALKNKYQYSNNIITMKTNHITLPARSCFSVSHTLQLKSSYPPIISRPLFENATDVMPQMMLSCEYMPISWSERMSNSRQVASSEPVAKANPLGKNWSNIYQQTDIII